MTKNALRLLAATTALTAPILAFVAARAVAARRLRRDARHLFATADNGPARVYHEAQLAGLPAPVQRYFRHVLPDGTPSCAACACATAGSLKPI